MHKKVRIPVHDCPSPLNPRLQAQVNEPALLMQAALLWQL